MGRKELKKKLSKKVELIGEDKSLEDNPLKSFIYIVGTMLVVVGVGFFILKVVMSDDNIDVPTIEEMVQEDKILAQDTTKQVSSEYVVFYVSDDQGLEQLSRYYDLLNSNRATLPAYVVDMQEAINAKHLVDDSDEVAKYGDLAPNVIEYNKEPETDEDIEVYNFPTVIHVSAGEIVGYYENDEVFEKLGLNEETGQ